MSMAIYSRSADEAGRVRELLRTGLPQRGIVTECIVCTDRDALAEAALSRDLNYALLCCESEADLLLACAVMKLSPGCRVVLIVANDELAVQSYSLGPCYCCRSPADEKTVETILRRITE